MGKRATILIIAWTVFAVWAIIATLLSSQNGPNTSETSLRLIRSIEKFVPLIRQHEATYNDILRKAAHVIIFMLLSSFLYCALYITLHNSRQAYIGAVGFSVLYALFDEAKKLFIPGRHLHWLDVGLNMTGVLLGLCVIFFLGSSLCQLLKE